MNRINQCYTSWRLQRSTKQAGAPKMTERSTRIVKRISRSVGFEHEVGDTWLHISSSQKHMWPVPVLSIMHTWSTMNKFICSCEVQVRLTLSYATNRRKNTNNYYIFRNCTCEQNIMWFTNFKLWNKCYFDIKIIICIYKLYINYPGRILE